MHTYDSEQYAQLQKSWSVGKSQGVVQESRARVARSCDWARANALDVGSVLVIGPQHGFELQEFQQQNAETLLGLDVVPVFVKDCQDIGFDCIAGPAERMLEHAAIRDGTWNIYCSHSLEHFVDQPLVLQAMRSVCHKWMVLVVPVAEVEPFDRAHVSQIASVSQMQQILSSDWTILEQWQKRKRRCIEYSVMVQPA